MVVAYLNSIALYCSYNVQVLCPTNPAQDHIPNFIWNIGNSALLPTLDTWSHAVATWTELYCTVALQNLDVLICPSHKVHEALSCQDVSYAELNYMDFEVISTHSFKHSSV